MGSQEGIHIARPSPQGPVGPPTRGSRRSLPIYIMSLAFVVFSHISFFASPGEMYTPIDAAQSSRLSSHTRLKAMLRKTWRQPDGGGADRWRGQGSECGELDRCWLVETRLEGVDQRVEPGWIRERSRQTRGGSDAPGPYGDASDTRERCTRTMLHPAVPRGGSEGWIRGGSRVDQGGSRVDQVYPSVRGHRETHGKCGRAAHVCGSGRRLNLSLYIIKGRGRSARSQLWTWGGAAVALHNFMQPALWDARRRLLFYATCTPAGAPPTCARRDFSAVALCGPGTKCWRPMHMRALARGGSGARRPCGLTCRSGRTRWPCTSPTASACPTAFRTAWKLGTFRCTLRTSARISFHFHCCLSRRYHA